MNTDSDVIFTFYAQCKNKKVAKYFADLLISSNQTQKRLLEEMILFCKDQGFKIDRRIDDAFEKKIESDKRKKEKLMKIKKLATA